jgi:hypothetical protein
VGSRGRVGCKSLTFMASLGDSNACYRRERAMSYERAAPMASQPPCIDLVENEIKEGLVMATTRATRTKSVNDRLSGRAKDGGSCSKGERVGSSHARGLRLVE